MGKSKFNVVVKTIVVVVVIIIICTSISGYMVYKNIKDNTSKNNLIQSYFISINNKDFKNLNTLVNKSLRINDLDKIQYIKDNLVEIKVTSIEKIENTKEEYQVKYIREWSKEFIPIGAEMPGINQVEQKITLKKEGQRWQIESIEPMSP